jgi:hypothetical protein
MNETWQNGRASCTRSLFIGAAVRTLLTAGRRMVGNAKHGPLAVILTHRWKAQRSNKGLRTKLKNTNEKSELIQSKSVRSFYMNNKKMLPFRCHERL